MVMRVAKLAAQYPRPSRNDLFALVLAAKKDCPILTGDKDLMSAAEAGNIEVRRTLWLVNELVTTGKISTHVELSGFQRMRAWDGAYLGNWLNQDCEKSKKRRKMSKCTVLSGQNTGRLISETRNAQEIDRGAEE